MTQPRAMNHAGITVTDIDEAVKWYQDVFGCTVVMAPLEAQEDGSHFSDIIADIFGAGFESMRIAHLATANGVGIELFQFSNPKTTRREENFEYWRTGIFHICITDPDVEGLAKRIEETGGKLRSKIWSLWIDKPYRVCYCEDPWGNIVELNSHSYEQIWANFSPPHEP